MSGRLPEALTNDAPKSTLQQELPINKPTATGLFKGLHSQGAALQFPRFSAHEEVKGSQPDYRWDFRFCATSFIKVTDTVAKK